jgi:hypothetical protein
MRGALRALLSSILVAACGGTVGKGSVIDDVERIRVSPGAQEGRSLAPEIHARAEQERAEAQCAHSAGHDIEAALHAERAAAAYAHALAVARRIRATTELEEARKSLASATAQTTSLEAAYEELQRKAEEMEQRVRAGRKHVSPGSGSAQDGSLREQARLLCDAAKMVAEDAPGLSEAEAELSNAKSDDGAEARQRCLDVLARARRAIGGDSGSADALLAELSAVSGWDPARDDRGVVITLRGAFRAAELTRNAAATLTKLGRVASAHPTYALQVVVHDAHLQRTADATDEKRAAAAIGSLVAGGASASRVKAELAGTRIPIVDPRDSNASSRNERMEVVFVGSGR